MMAVDDRDTNGAPIFLSGEALDTAADLTTLGSEIYERGTRLIGSTAERTSYEYTGKGLGWFDTTDDTLYVNTGSGWGAVWSDTGWVDLSSYLAAGFTGTMRGRRVADQVEIYGELSGSVESGTVTDIVASGNPLPSLWRPSAGNRWGAAYSAFYSLNVTVRPAGTMGIGNRVGSTITTPQFSVKYMI